MKRFFVFILICVLIFAVIPVGVFADGEPPVKVYSNPGQNGNQGGQGGSGTG